MVLHLVEGEERTLRGAGDGREVKDADEETVGGGLSGRLSFAVGALGG